jgi:putative membrane protein
LEPALLIGLVLTLLAGWVIARDRWRFGLGGALVAFLFISPLCAASMALFSARVAQHILLTLVAAPLIASALPRLPLSGLPAAILFGVLFWVWHAPAPYAATLQSDLIYWAMHISLTGSAIMLFSALRAAPERGLGPAALTAAQLTCFAVLLTLSPSHWHDWHSLTTIPYGLGPLEDQQLAGALMWVAGGALFMALIGILTWRFVSEQPVASPRMSLVAGERAKGNLRNPM